MKTLALAALLGLAGAALAEDTLSAALDPNGTLTLDTYKGSVTITTADVKEVQATYRIEADGSEPGSADNVKKTQVRISGGGASVRLESDYGGVRKQSSSWFGGFVGDNETGSLPFVHYTVRIPKGASLKVADYKSTLDIAGIGGDLDLETYKGTATLKDLNGAVRVNTYKGNVRAELVRFGKDSRFETYKGEVDIRLPASAAFSLDADTGKGSVTSTFDAGGRSGILTGRVQLKVNGGGPSLRLSTHKGTFRLQKR